MDSASLLALALQCAADVECTTDSPAQLLRVALDYANDPVIAPLLKRFVTECAPKVLGQECTDAELIAMRLSHDARAQVLLQPYLESVPDALIVPVTVNALFDVLDADAEMQRALISLYESAYMKPTTALDVVRNTQRIMIGVSTLLLPHAAEPAPDWLVLIAYCAELILTWPIAGTTCVLAARRILARVYGLPAAIQSDEIDCDEVQLVESMNASEMAFVSAMCNDLANWK